MRLLLCLYLFFTSSALWAQADKEHFSAVFQQQKQYRIFLPKGYGQQAEKRYAVVYYLHGNKGNHQFSFAVQPLVDKHQTILVAWNGQSVPGDARPYNIGYHSNINYEVQFKDYFPELIQHIDSTYRTHTGRNRRAVIGHSMGGFMAFLLAGKYPHLVCALVNSKGSPEFFVGYPKNHTLLQPKYLHGNFYGVRTRFQMGGPGEELHFLNKEVNAGAKRELGLSYVAKEYPGTHAFKPEEFNDAFEFVTEAMRNPLPQPVRWHHTDSYADFKVWGYDVSSNLNQPGFIELKGVTEGGFSVRTKKWLPDGPLIAPTNITVVTAPLYKPGAKYTLLDYNVTDDTKKTVNVAADMEGRIRFITDGKHNQVGILPENASPEIVFARYKIGEGGKFLPHKVPGKLALSLLNRGGTNLQNLTVTLQTTAAGVKIINPIIKASSINSGETAWLPAHFTIDATGVKPTEDGSPFQLRFNIEIKNEKGNRWLDEVDIPIWYAVPEFENIGIDDGDSEIYGSGNGNNIAEPGETIMIYQHSNRTRLYYDDPYVEEERLHDDLQPDKWGDGYALSSLIRISKDCPPGHQIRFLASYENKEWKTIKRNVTWGTFTITIGNPSEK